MTPLPRPRLALAALVLIGASQALAQTASSTADTTAPAPAAPKPVTEGNTVTLGQFVVVGDRASLASALEIKKDNQQIVDSIVADDITKLPDTNTAEALERIAGIQVGINTGEIGGNGGLAIRGLTEVENTVDGREVFTAGGTSTGGVGAGTRTYDYSDLPSALVGGIDVYKTSAADQIEGGLGGLINVRLHKPFDFAEGLTSAVTVGTIYNVMDAEDKPNMNFLVSDWANTSIGKIGVLVDYAYTAIPIREDNIGVGNPTAMPAGVVPGAAANATFFSAGYTSDSALSIHQHTGVNFEFQWQPMPNLTLYAGGNYEDFWIRETEYELSMSLPAANAVAGSGTMFSGNSTDIQSVSFSNVTGSDFGIIRDVTHQERQYHTGAVWTTGDLQLKFDLSREDFAYGFYNNAVYGAVTVPGFSMNINSAIPTGYATGASLLDASNYSYKGGQVYNRLYPSTGYQTGGTLDGVYTMKSGFFTALEAGIRYSGTEDDNGTTGLYLGAYNLPTVPYGTYPGQIMTNPVTNFFEGYKNQVLSQYLTPLTTNLRNPAQVLQTYGDTTTTISTDAAINPLSLFHIDEQDADAYLEAKFAANVGLPLDGNFGVRFASTTEDVRGFQTVVATATTAASIAPLTLTSTYTDVLPSLNMRLKLTDTLFFRFAASKTMTRPQFSQLSPSLTLNANPITPSLDAGSAGNPALKPDRSTNFDVSLEKYFGRDTSVFADAFTKSVNGFPLTLSDIETYGGLAYTITRPVNLNTATVRGLEFGYQEFFDFLPAPLDGFGFQGNFTYADSSTPSSIETYSAPLPALSRDSYNAILMYEKGIFSARLAYNYRSKFFNSATAIVGLGTVPQFTKGYGEVDGSLNFALTKNLTLHLDGQNLTNTLREFYWTTLTRPSNYYLDGVNLLASVTLKL